MKASELRNELRIGNLILINGEITTVGNYTFSQIESEPESFNPIPLTEEWLIRAGFKYVENESYINKKQWLMQVTDDFLEEDELINRDGTWFDAIGTYSYKRNREMGVNVLCRGNYVCNSVNTVHELQNLYFTLTGKELEFKEQE